jgi:hypothetical protein
MILFSHGGQIVPAAAVVNQADDKVPHDRTPLLIEVVYSGALFPDVFEAEGKWLRRRPRIVSSSLER